jgi:hypothetical protein
VLVGLGLLVAFPVIAILLVRFRKRWVAGFNLAVTNRITSRFAAWLPGFGILTHFRAEVRAALPHADQRLSHPGRIPARPHLRTRYPVGAERSG